LPHFSDGLRAQQSDAYMLDRLVKNGTLTADEAADIKKQTAECPVITAPNAEEITIFSYIQVRYSYTNEDFSKSYFGSVGRSDICLRRLIAAFTYKLKVSTEFEVVLYPADKNFLDTVTLTQRIDCGWLRGKLMMGYIMPNFSQEDYESGSRILTPERSLASSYWGGGDWSYESGDTIDTFKATQCFSGRHMGVTWCGIFPDNDNLIYGFGITNSQCDRLEPTDGNGISYWFNVGYEIREDGFTLTAGVNSGYADKLMGAIDPGAVPPAQLVDYASTLGLNPYLWLKWGSFTLQTEGYASRMAYGKTESAAYPIYTTNSADAYPMGGYILTAYNFDIGTLGGLEPVFRYTYLNSDGRGIDTSDIMYGVTSAGYLYNSANAYYLGVNWYVRSNIIKYTAGWEHVDFQDAPVGPNYAGSSVDVFTIQMQIVF